MEMIKILLFQCDKIDIVLLDIYKLMVEEPI